MEPGGEDGSDGEAFLLRFVRDQDVACPSCEYNLRALTTARCPECGEMLKMQVGLAEPKLGLWLLTLVPLLLFAGPGVLCFILCFWRRPAGDEAFLIYGIIISVPPACLALMTRRPFARLCLRSRQLLATASVAYFLVMATWTLAKTFG